MLNTFRSTFRSAVILAVGEALLGTHLASASVSLIFTNGGSSPVLTSVSPGGTFNFSVNMVETSTSDQVSGVDFQIQASTSGVFKFLSRNSQVAGSQFTFPSGYVDSGLSPIVLSPSNGTDLGTGTASNNAVSGPATYEISDFSFQVLPGTPTGAYTLSFIKADTGGAPPSFPTGNFSSLGTYTVFVPGPPLVGDANFDGKIDGSDYSLIDNGYVNHLTGWSNGDFNLDGVVDGSDYTLIDNAFNTQPTPSAQIADEIAAKITVESATSVTVPEPTSIGLLAVGSLLTLKRARSKSSPPGLPLKRRSVVHN